MFESMNQDKAKQVIIGMAFSHSTAVSTLLTSISKGKSNSVESQPFEKQAAERRITDYQIAWVMNRSITL